MLWIGLGVLALVIVLLVHMVRESNRTTVLHHSIPLAKLPPAFEGTTILFISDLHRRHIVPKDIIALGDLSQIELVLVGGDMLERGVPFERVLNNMALLQTIAPVYAVHGNHDYDVDHRKLDVSLKDQGVRVLDNESVMLEKNDERIWLVGVDDPITKRARLDLAYSEVPYEDECCLLLSHDPSLAHCLNAYSADLVLSGHTHGGQVCLPWWGPIYTATHPTHRKYVAGLFDLPHKNRDGSFKLLVSRGFGTSKFPIRLNCPAEIHIIKLGRNM